MTKLGLNIDHVATLRQARGSRYPNLVRAALVCVPWALAIHVREPDYWRFFFWHEHIRRFSSDNAQHARAWWFFLPIMLVACLPWAALLPAKSYRMVVNHFQASGGDGYPLLTSHASFADSGFVDAQVLRGYIGAHSPLNALDFEPGDAVVRR